MIQLGDLRYSILVGEKILPLLFEAIEWTYRETDKDGDFTAKLTGPQILAEELLHVLEVDTLFIEIVREARPGKGPEGYRFLNSQDHDWESWESARDEFARELQKGGEIRIIPLQAFFEEGENNE